MSTITYINVPSRTDKGPLRPRDVELARMPCYVGYDYPDDGKYMRSLTHKLLQ